jgi:hypothetical protein
VGIAGNQNEAPDNYKLYQNYPNPFNPVTKIKFNVPASNLTLNGVKGPYVELIIYDILGREVAVLVNKQMKPGTYEIEWDAASYSSGIYFTKLVSGSFSDVKKMIMVK